MNPPDAETSCVMPRLALRHHVVERGARDAQLRPGQNQHRYRYQRGPVDRLVNVLRPVAPLECGRVWQEAVLRDEHVLRNDRVAAGSFMPTMNQVSSIVTSPMGISDSPRFVISPRSLAM